MTELTCDITLGEVEMTLIFEAEQYIAPSWGYSGGDPGQPAHHYPDSLIEYGKEPPSDRLNRLFAYYEDEIDMAMIDYLEAVRVDKEADYADHIYDRIRDERMTRDDG